MKTASLIIAGVALIFVVGFLVQRMTTPRNDVSPAAVVLGTAADFPIGVPVELELEVASVAAIPREANFRPEDPAPPPLRNGALLFVVAQPGGEIMAFDMRSPWLGCRLKAVENGAEINMIVPAGFETGFIDFCHGGVYGLDGSHLAGPGRRGLDRFPVTVEADGTVVANLSWLRPGPVD